MRQSDAAMLVSKLAAAFPLAAVPESTLALYAEELSGMGDLDAAQESVQGLIRSATRWPPLADLLAAYRQTTRRRQEELARGHVLDEPEVVPGPEHARAVLAGLPSEGGAITEALRTYMEGVAGIDRGGGQSASIGADEVEANPGMCADCRKEVPRRVTYGHFELCPRHRDRRLQLLAETTNTTAAAAPEPDAQERGGGEGGHHDE